jgi:polar amino acid transport system substrate-binding protein
MVSRPSRILPVALVAAAVLAAGALAGGDAAPPTKTKGVLTAAIELGNPGFAEGTLRTAHGFDVDVAKALARRMGLRAKLVNYPFGRLFLPGAKPYDVALEFVTILPGRARFVDFSVPYYSSTQGVLVASDITGPVTLARLRKLQVCAKQVTTGFQYVEDVIRPEGLILEYAAAAEALNALSTSICDAFVFDLPVLAAAKGRTPNRYGALAGRLGPTERYGVVLPKGSKLRAVVSKAVLALQRDGTIRKAAAASFGPTLGSIPVIR